MSSSMMLRSRMMLCVLLCASGIKKPSLQIGAGPLLERLVPFGVIADGRASSRESLLDRWRKRDDNSDDCHCRRYCDNLFDQDTPRSATAADLCVQQTRKA
jgi:hypothetical protein